MKYIRKSLILCALTLLLTSCAAGNSNSAAPEADNEIESNNVVESVHENNLSPQNENIEAAAESILYSAFSFDAAGRSGSRRGPSGPGCQTRCGRSRPPQGG